ncbi:DUF554 domain-containing protein [Gudongella oleilytica]|uniref:DUF554 domain-containing protein n=1 Tax=Gudongella oleilytica TaxID=1582259 RepID=UPI000FF8AF5E|nr:DUF554 domain-containing protein [Gudongella oleilytica]
MLGAVANSLGILFGALIGLVLKKGIKECYTNTIMDGISIAVIVLGLMSAIEMQNVILVLASLVIGTIIGEWLNIDSGLENLGKNLEKRFGQKDSTFSKGFVTASLMYCIGAMAILGAVESGLTGNHETLFAKAVLDFIVSIILASTMGIGVAFAAIPVLLYEGGITLLAGGVKNFMTPEVINEMSAVGGILIMAIGVNALGLKKIKLANMLPAVFIPIIYYLVAGLF